MMQSDVCLSRTVIKPRSRMERLRKTKIGDRGTVFTVGTYCHVAVRRGWLGGARRFGRLQGRRRAGHIVAAPAQLVKRVQVVPVRQGSGLVRTNRRR